MYTVNRSTIGISALLLMGFPATCEEGSPPSQPPAPLPIDNTIGNTDEGDCVLSGEPAELDGVTDAAFVRSSGEIPYPDFRANVIGVVSRGRGNNAVCIGFCDTWGWCSVEASDGTRGLVHESVLKRDRAAESDSASDARTRTASARRRSR